MRTMQIIGLAFVLLAFLTSAFLYPSLPEKMASHWDINGQVNGYLGKDVAVFLVPALSLLIIVTFLVLPNIDPRKQNYKLFQKEYDMMAVLLVGFLYYIHLLTLAYNLRYSFDMIQFIAPAFGALIYYIGSVLEKAKQNWFVGIRTPWTLSSEGVWEKTHKMSGKLFKAAGIIALIGIIFPAAGLGASIAVLIATAVFAVVYSYLEFEKEKKAKLKR